MKKNILILILLISVISVVGQNKNHKLSVSASGSINHYNGNLGNSFFQFKTTCFAGFGTNFGLYLNKSLDLNITNSIGRYGYCPTDEDNQRIVPFELQCPGETCEEISGMGNLRSQIVSSNVSVKYKLANGYLLPENAKLAPYVYGGAGFSWLTDVMKRQCVNVGRHFTINTGAGVSYNITERVNIGYDLGLATFMTKKVYATNASAGVAAVEEDHHHDETEIHDHTISIEAIQMEKRKDLMLQNAFTVGFNF